MTIIKKKNTIGETYFLIRVQLRSKIQPHIRIQKQTTLKGKLVNAKKAKRREQELTYTCMEELKKREGSDLSFQELIDLWYSYKVSEEFITLETVGDYYRALQKWCFSILTKPCNEIATSDVKVILKMQKDEGISRSFRRKFKSMINNVYKWGFEEGYLHSTKFSPTVGIQLERREEKKPEILTLQQTREFLNAARTLEHPWYPVWAFAILTGARNGELYALNKNDVDLENNKIIISKSFNNRRGEIKSTKAGYYRTVPINPELKELILELNRANLDSDFLLPRLSGWNKGCQAQVLRTFLTGINLPSVKFHTLRACFATLLLQQGKAPAVIMKICGWRDLKTMERYIRLAGVDEKGATDSLKVLPLKSLDEEYCLNFPQR